MKISTFTFKGKDIEMSYGNGHLAYTFMHEGQTYGQKVKLPSKGVMDIASVAFLLLTNAIETMETLNDTK